MTAAVLVLLLLLAAGCAPSPFAPGRVSVVASFYPLAWLAQQIGGSKVSVLDLTPPGIDAHDTVLTASERAALQDADVVLILGYFGFQPDVEQAARSASGTVVPVADALGSGTLVAADVGDLRFDPHVWLDPALMQRFVPEVEAALAKAGASDRGYFASRAATVTGELASLTASFRSGLSSCRWRGFVVTHSAFGYMAREFGLRQVGIEGLAPESEPTASQVEFALQAIRDGTAAPVVYYEVTDEGRRIGESVAGDAGVPASPLNTLEFQPSSGDYLSAMSGDLSNLERGLSCR